MASMSTQERLYAKNVLADKLYGFKATLTKASRAQVGRWCICKTIWTSTMLESCFKTLRKEGMERVSPVWLAYKCSWHDFAAAKGQNQQPQLHVSFAVGCKAKVFWSPSGTLYPKARGLSPQHSWEQAPCVFAARPCFSCPLNCKVSATTRQAWNESSNSYVDLVPLLLLHFHQFQICCSEMPPSKDRSGSCLPMTM